MAATHASTLPRDSAAHVGIDGAPTYPRRESKTQIASARLRLVRAISETDQILAMDVATENVGAESHPYVSVEPGSARANFQIAQPCNPTIPKRLTPVRNGVESRLIT